MFLSSFYFLHFHRFFCIFCSIHSLDCFILISRVPFLNRKSILLVLFTMKHRSNLWKIFMSLNCKKKNNVDNHIGLESIKCLTIILTYKRRKTRKIHHPSICKEDSLFFCQICAVDEWIACLRSLPSRKA